MTTLTSTSRRPLVLPGSTVGVLGFVLGVSYALLRFYHGAGGIGLGLTEPTAEGMPHFLAGLLIMVGGIACLVLTYPQFRTFPRWLGRLGGRQAPRPLMVAVCVLPVLIGAMFGIGHGAGGGIADLLELTGVGVASVFPDHQGESTVELLWLVAFYAPWFLGMGICLAMSALAYLQQTGGSPRLIRSVAIIVAVAGFVCSTFFVLSMMLHWEWTVI